MATLEPMRPWLAAMILTELPLQSAGYDPNAGLDMTLKAEADKRGEKIVGFETIEDQVRDLADLPERVQIKFLETTLDDVSKGLALVDTLAKAWINGDTKTINELALQDARAQAPEVYQQLLLQRNIQWSDKIADLLKRSGVQLIAVGAAHLVGDDSVQAQLAKRGIRVDHAGKWCGRSDPGYGRSRSAAPSLNGTSAAMHSRRIAFNVQPVSRT